MNSWLFLTSKLTVGVLVVSMVGVRGFEPPAPASRRQCSTRLSYTPTMRLNDRPPLSLFSRFFSRFGIPRTLPTSIGHFYSQMEAGVPEPVAPVQHTLLRYGKCTQGSQWIQ